MIPPLVSRAFLERDVVDVARDLIGVQLVREHAAGRVVLRVTECEAYRGAKDSAAHSRAGRTARTEPMFGPAGHAYVYLCYGIHWMLNIVAGEPGAAILVRSCEVIEGIDVVTTRRRHAAAPTLVAGPGKVAQALALDGAWNHHDLCAPAGLELRAGAPGLLVVTGPRVGIDFALTRDRRALLRFALAGSPAATARATLRARTHGAVASARARAI